MQKYCLTKVDLLRLKIELLCNGARLKADLERGRKAGAGPAGGRCIILPNGFKVNIALWGRFPNQSSWEMRENDGDCFLVRKERKHGKKIPVRVVPRPSFYSRTTSDGIPMWKIALLHGTDCLATTVYQKCAYVNTGEGCKFCGIELSLKSGSTIMIKKSEQFNEVVEAAINEGVCNHITLTTGSTASPDRGSNRLVDIVKEVKRNWKIPIHVQVEPPKKEKYLEMLADAGADTIGIHIESFDQNVLKEVCPGKAQIGLKRYFEAWKKSVELFGENQVSSFIIAGIGESDESILIGSEELAKLGVIPYLVPFRPMVGTQFENRQPPDPNRIFSLLNRIAETLKTYDINLSKNKAGCVRCGSCSAIQDAQL